MKCRICHEYVIDDEEAVPGTIDRDYDLRGEAWHDCSTCICIYCEAKKVEQVEEPDIQPCPICKVTMIDIADVSCCETCHAVRYAEERAEREGGR